MHATFFLEQHINIVNTVTLQNVLFIVNQKCTINVIVLYTKQFQTQFYATVILGWHDSRIVVIW